jgi:hypothetical protein
MTLHPSVSATLGNLRYDSHAMRCTATLGLLPRGSSAEITLPPAVRFEAAPGDDATLDVDGGEGSSTILTGKVRSVRRTLEAIVVTVADAAGDLASFRPSATYEKQKAAQIVRALAGEVAISPGSIDIDLDLPAYVAHPGRTASEHIAELARLGGGFAHTGGDGKLNVVKRPSGQATAALKYGREIVSYDVSKAAVVNGQRFAIGFGPAGSGSAIDALRHSLEGLPADAAEGGAGVHRSPTPVLRTPAAAQTASESLQAAAAAHSERLVARGFLLAALRPGDVIEVQELPSGLSGGPWLLTRVEHTIEDGAGATALEATTADTGSLLGDLLGAIGGLL